MCGMNEPHTGRSRPASRYITGAESPVHVRPPGPMGARGDPGSREFSARNLVIGAHGVHAERSRAFGSGSRTLRAHRAGLWSARSQSQMHDFCSFLLIPAKPMCTKRACTSRDELGAAGSRVQSESESAARFHGRRHETNCSLWPRQLMQQDMLRRTRIRRQRGRVRERRSGLMCHLKAERRTE